MPIAAVFSQKWISVAASKGIVGRGWVKEVGWKGYAVSDKVA
jgi:hypothetical protein